ncbi:uncharacterized protein LOC126370442 [Pectinophora gossypiella]|uniref:uncharacterized protein LOC126370442 n=1 Tax=Pectinophora gossypiella TaxID=13191 RepID=UPI00214F4908|nr:uncharacterized protein LOC126370442 [Pectinophora gossypiella]
MEGVHIRVQIKTNKCVVISLLLSIIRSVDVQFAMPMPMFAPPPPPPMYAVPAGPQIQVAVMPVAIPDFDSDKEESSSTPAIQGHAGLAHNHQHHMAIPLKIPMSVMVPPPIMLVPRYPPTMSSSEKDGKEEKSASSEKKSDSSGSGSCSSGDSGSGSYRRTRKHLRHGRRKKLRKLSRHRLHMSRRSMSRDRPSIRPILSFIDGHGDIKASRKLHRTDIRELMEDNSEKVARDYDKQAIKEKRRKLQQSVQKVNEQADNTLVNMALISDFAQKIKEIKAHNPLPMQRPMGRQEVVQEHINKAFNPEDHKVTNLSVSFHVT